MATHVSILAGIIPWREEPGGPPSMASQIDIPKQLRCHTQQRSVTSQ